MRINAFLAKLGLGSRRKVEELVLSGRIKVNGSTITDLSFQVSEEDSVSFDGKAVQMEAESLKRPKIIAFNKPAGYLTSHEDKFHENTIFSLLPEGFQKYNYAGRLDLDSRGLLLLSFDGDFIQKVTHPRNKIDKEYIISLKQPVAWKAIAEEFMLGVREGGDTLRALSVKPANVVPEKTAPGFTSYLSIILKEGKKRQIRRMCKAKEMVVLDLYRIRIGKLDLRDFVLDEGKYKVVTEEQVLGKPTA
ncbi:23S rRNA pseudouridine2605 synthase [Leptospira meyeri]|uniref:23S rRNA pseudouridine2605 synthase n=1 Tax=Leptospira meyeri TaxID=29508 RepID=A0A4R8MVK8_LEPME|nr:pseudouridine synthase [Leptospira meyeri]EKJ85072.1 pseudouridylate synthase [Leptospira meyeri serovar Hardjo str. Went 5]TDY71787.1 23S rRNA pseudouridine2605 synthase [Leptospira meyeri]TGL47908.1 rRNA pseudouridine synthase [Leptospira meyeri]